MNSTFQNSAQVLSIGIFFTLMIVGLSATLPTTLFHGLVAHGVPVVGRGDGGRTCHRCPSSSPLSRLQPHPAPARHAGTRPPAGGHQAAVLTGRGFFPALIRPAFASGLHAAFDFAIVACLVAAGLSWLRGGQYHYREDAGPNRADHALAEPAEPT